jgi:uncharacterized alkaline shock family protein YloU
VPASGAAQPPLEAILASPTEHEPGLSLVSRRAIGQIVRSAVAGSYGVTGLSDDRLAGQLLVRLGLRPPAIVVRLGSGIRIELRVLVAAGVPVAEVARQVDATVRYSVRRAIGREIDSVTIHVGGLRFQAAPLPEPLPGPALVEPYASGPDPVDALRGTGSDAA